MRQDLAPSSRGKSRPLRREKNFRISFSSAPNISNDNKLQPHNLLYKLRKISVHQEKKYIKRCKIERNNGRQNHNEFQKRHSRIVLSLGIILILHFPPPVSL
ncbi:MAG: hypothetical protein ACYS8W_20690, partial [Planctomycetota bacterium]